MRPFEPTRGRIEQKWKVFHGKLKFTSAVVCYFKEEPFTIIPLEFMYKDPVHVKFGGDWATNLGFIINKTNFCGILKLSKPTI